MRAMPRWAVNRSTNISKAILFSEGCEILSRTFPNWISCLAFVMCHCSFCPTSSIQQQGPKRRERLCAWDWEINTGYMWHSVCPKSVHSLKKKKIQDSKCNNGDGRKEHAESFCQDTDAGAIPPPAHTPAPVSTPPQRPLLWPDQGAGSHELITVRLSASGLLIVWNEQ